MTTVVVTALLVVATWTDARRGKIYNWLTYPGLLAALAVNAAATWFEVDLASRPAGRWWLDLVGLWDSIGGLLLCGGVMLVCYVSFLGGVGGGDIKLMAMLGAWLGPYQGLEVMLWTFVVAAAMAGTVIVWRIGAGRLLAGVWQYIAASLRLRRPAPLTPEQRQPLRAPLFLAPSAVIALALVKMGISGV